MADSLVNLVLLTLTLRKEKKLPMKTHQFRTTKYTPQNSFLCLHEVVFWAIPKNAYLVNKTIWHLATETFFSPLQVT